MLDYIVIEEDNPDDLARAVKRYLIQGYKPQGGVCSACYVGTNRDDEVTSRCYFYQALVKED